MKKEQLLRMIEDKREEVKEIYIASLKMYKNGIYDIKEYEKIGAVEKGYWGSYSGLLEKLSKSSERLDNLNILGVIQELGTFNKEWKKLKAIGKSEIDDKFAGSEYGIEECCFEYSFYILDEEKLEVTQKERCRKMVSELLKPEKEKSANLPDCKMVELFKNGSIDWETLQKITYKNCDL